MKRLCPNSRFWVRRGTGLEVSADSFRVTVKQNGCFDKHSTPFVGICETYDGGIQRESLAHA